MCFRTAGHTADAALPSATAAILRQGVVFPGCFQVVSAPQFFSSDNIRFQVATYDNIRSLVAAYDNIRFQVATYDNIRFSCGDV